MGLAVVQSFVERKTDYDTTTSTHVRPVLQEGAGGHQECRVGPRRVQREAVQGGGDGRHAGRGPQESVGQCHHPHHHGGHPHQALPSRVCGPSLDFKGRTILGDQTVVKGSPGLV